MTRSICTPHSVMTIQFWGVTGIIVSIAMIGGDAERAEWEGHNDHENNNNWVTMKT